MMPRSIRFYLLFGLSFACLVGAILLTFLEMQKYRTSLSVFPPGSMLAGIPTGGLDAEDAGARVALSYALTPVELRIDGSPVHINPIEAGQELGISAMLAEFQNQMMSRPLWSSFWDYLMNRPAALVEIPLNCSVNQTALRAYLENLVGQRYDLPASPARPVPGDVLFLPGTAGRRLALDEAQPRIETSLCSQVERVVELQTRPTPAPPPDLALVGPQLEALVQGSGFDGVIEVYFQDLRSGTEIDFAYAQGRPIQPTIAFTAASTIKIPVLVSAYKVLTGSIPEDLRVQIAQMIDLSDNLSTDAVMQRVLDPNLAPLQVTEDIRALGIENTFLAGLFYPGAPLLQRIETPANQRPDISTDPDIYNQTTPADMGRLLAAIQHCADTNQGKLVETFTGQVTQVECQEMLGFLIKNKKGVLIENGLPEGTQLARKYGWVTDPLDGLMHSASDAAVVYTPGGNFALAVYYYHAEQLNWDRAQRLAARLATALSNYYLLLAE